MSAAGAIESISATTTILAGILPVPLPQPIPKVSMEVVFPDFHFGLDIRNTLLTEAEPGVVVAKVRLDADVLLHMKFAGGLRAGATEFQPAGVYLQLESENRPRAEFVATTITALLGLAEEVRLVIRSTDIDLSLNLNNIDLALPTISQMLQRRQTAYRLLVIEEAMGMHLSLPSTWSSKDVNEIAFIYHAIVDRSFVWPFTQAVALLQATEKGLEALNALNQKPVTVPQGPLTMTLFEESISLGPQMVTINDGFIERLDEVRKELATNDGHPVSVVVRSLGEQAIYELPQAPRLPAREWDTNIKSLILLEAQLDALLCERYHALAAATLDGLTEGEKARITARPELDEGAFVTNDLGRKQG
jgi:hypothetical protein